MLRRILLSSRYTGLSRVLTKPQFTRTIAPTCSSVSAIHINRSYSRHTRSGEEKMVAIASYEDVKAAGGNDNVLIIDVREPNELEETGKIPASINVPCQINYFSRQFSINSEDDRIATYNDVLKINRETLLVDVREPSELKETGILPKSVNIPLGEVETAFKDLSSEQFEKKYGIEKPNFETPIVFSCKAGIRSDKAMRAVESMGYSKTKNYKGGWLDWEANTVKK